MDVSLGVLARQRLQRRVHGGATARGGVDYNFRRGGHAMDATPVLEPVARFAAVCGTDAPTYSRDRPGLSAFALEDGVVHHTYSAYARGLDGLWGAYQWLDRAPWGATRRAPGGAATTSTTSGEPRRGRRRRNRRGGDLTGRRQARRIGAGTVVDLGAAAGGTPGADVLTLAGFGLDRLGAAGFPFA